MSWSVVVLALFLSSVHSRLVPSIGGEVDCTLLLSCEGMTKCLQEASRLFNLEYCLEGEALDSSKQLDKRTNPLAAIVQRHLAGRIG